MADPVPAIQFTHVSRHFGAVRAVHDVSFAVPDGEFFSLLGPSGSGKTTCLRLIAGFDQPDAGVIHLYGQDVTTLPPYERDVNTVFQDYALFPHMTVGENIGYGLMIRQTPRSERDRRVAEMLDLVRLPGYEKRKPAQLSGGQRQRVALARALINRPRALLLDEPLGALDLKLRQQMQLELKAIQAEIGITFIFVTHDQEEALTMSDRIAIFNQGQIEQIGVPAMLYERPATRFVATFVGISNLLSGVTARVLTGSERTVALRPEKIRLLTPEETSPEGMATADGEIRDQVYLGVHTRYTVQLDVGGEMIVVEQNLTTTANAARGRRVRLAWSPAAQSVLED